MSDLSSNTVIVDTSGNNTVIVDTSGNNTIPTTSDSSGNITSPVTTYTLYDASGNPVYVTPDFSWDIRKMEVVPSENGMTNIVKYIHWTYNATATINGVEYKTYYSDITTLPTPTNPSFVQYEDLTPEIVYGWLDEFVNFTFVNTFISNNLQNAFNPPILALPLPF